MNDAFLSLLGLMRRAGKLSPGFDAVVESCLKGKAELVIHTSDCSGNTLKKLKTAVADKAQIFGTSYDMDQLGRAVGKAVKVISINDAGFAAKARTLLNIGSGEENTYGN